MQVEPAVSQALWSFRASISSHETLADLRQEAIIRILERLDQPRGGSDAQILGWCARVAANLARDHGRVSTRRHELRQEHRGDIAAALRAPAAADAPGAEARSEQCARVQEALETIGPDKEELVLARAIAGLSWREVGRDFGIGREAARQRYRRAIAELRARLDELLEEDQTGGAG